MLYMVVERFKEDAAPKIYQRFRENGRMMPEGLDYVSSWIDLDFKICYQLMRTENFALLDKWIARLDGVRNHPGAHVRRGGSAHEYKTVEDAAGFPYRFDLRHPGSSFE
jgi:hypothetical protein